MIKPKFITFTGIDARTDVERVEYLSMTYPVEWGILFSERNQGKVNRYPALTDLIHLMGSPILNKGLNLSAHICGRYSRTIMEQGADIPIEFFLRAGFARTQINVADGETMVHGDIRPERAADFAKAIRADKAIVQCRGNFPDDPRVDWLFDVSGGAGIQPKSWDAHALTSSAFCGYAGGIGPDNVVDILERISWTHPEGKPFWIDMEGNIRNDADWLDLDKCEAVLRAVYG
jgi:hypothetical protein